MKLYAIRDKRTGELRTAPGTFLFGVAGYLIVMLSAEYLAD